MIIRIFYKVKCSDIASIQIINLTGVEREKHFILYTVLLIFWNLRQYIIYSTDSKRILNLLQGGFYMSMNINSLIRTEIY